jgi:hypothetical protein
MRRRRPADNNCFHMPLRLPTAGRVRAARGAGRITVPSNEPEQFAEAVADVYVVDYLGELRAVGISARTVQLERDGWIY